MRPLSKIYFRNKEEIAISLFYLIFYFLIILATFDFRLRNRSQLVLVNSAERPKITVVRTVKPHNSKTYSTKQKNKLFNRRKHSNLLTDDELPLKLAHLIPSPLSRSHPCRRFPFPERTRFWPCHVCYLSVRKSLKAQPELAFKNETVVSELTYATKLSYSEKYANYLGYPPRFAGYPSWKDRSHSFQIKPKMQVHCGFVWSKSPGQDGGYDISKEDREEMHKCKDIVVVSAIFGAYDLVKQPENISAASRRNIRFFMFVDQETYDDLCERNKDVLDEDAKLYKLGFWRIILAKNLPYTNPRRNGRVPKLLLHRFFPNVKYSIWVDGKLKLIADPYQILERFLWRNGNSFAISNHFRNFDIFKEAQAIKNLGRFDNKSIDEQINFYLKDGMKRYTKRKLPLISDVPESCVVVRDHSAISNLFGCLWFNEVDRFTARDQISFGYVRDRILKQVPWKTSMFLDCERRNFSLVVDHIPDMVKKELLFNESLDEDSRKQALKILEESKKINDVAQQKDEFDLMR